MQNMKMMDFDPVELGKHLDEYTADLLLSLKAENDEQAQNLIQMIDALKSNIDIMQRVDSDYQANGVDSITLNDINQIGDYAMTLIGELAMAAGNRGLQQVMIKLTRLSVPISAWLVSHKGKILQLEIVVNAIASYANELTEVELLGQLCHHIENIMLAIEDDVKRDLEATNPVRPWRILNLNWGIVATRSHNAELIDRVYAQLIKNIPADIHGFVTEAMQQMDIIGYPDHVRKVVAKYYSSLGYDQALH
ncbi:MAG: hypothetical protein OQK76_04995 [Gammaproteobacteria bacterium]|nr:hypothetical protein [Gammaproteobacteria bacterium]